MTDFAATVARLGLTVSAVFVPFSQSRNAKADAKVSDRSLNWKVTLRQNGRDILTSDYGAGIGHCPYVKRHNVNYQRMTLETVEAITLETEKGRAWSGNTVLGAAILPDSLDVISSFALDASAIDHPTFESWADDYGYDHDSRKAEAMYRACVGTALALRSALGEAGLQELRDAASEH